MDGQASRHPLGEVSVKFDCCVLAAHWAAIDNAPFGTLALGATPGPVCPGFSSALTQAVWPPTPPARAEECLWLATPLGHQQGHVGADGPRISSRDAWSPTYGAVCDRRDKVEWRVLPTGQRVWGVDGKWHPERFAGRIPLAEQATWKPASPPGARGPGQHAWIVAMVTTVVVLVLVGGGLLAYSLKQNTPPSTVAGAIPGTTMTASQLNSLVRDQLATTGVDGFHVHGISSVRCHPPQTWTSGATFGCDIYAPSGHVMGQYLATVRASNGNGTPEWTGKWVAEDTPGTSSTTTP